MYIPLVTVIIMLLGLFFSPYVRGLTKNSILKPVYHITFILCALFVVPGVILPLADSPVAASTETGSYFFYLGILALAFVCVKCFWWNRVAK